jgi:Tfp pilus assembly protein PilO
MVLSKRERWVVVGAIVLVAALALDRLAVSPLLDASAAQADDVAAKQAQLQRDGASLSTARKLQPAWQQHIKSGLRTTAGEAEQQGLQSLRDWAAQSGLTLTQLKPARPNDKTVLPQVTFQVSAVGAMEALESMLEKIEKAAQPMRLTELQVASRKEGANDLSIQMRLSTIYNPPAARPAGDRK